MGDYTREDEEFYRDSEQDALNDNAEPTETEVEFHANMEPDALQVGKPYVNICWNCAEPISSEFCEPDPGFGYKCNKCGKSLRERQAMREGKLRGQGS